MSVTKILRKNAKQLSLRALNQSKLIQNEYREKAKLSFNYRDNLLEQSKEAYLSGNRRKAALLSDKAKSQMSIAVQCNVIAAAMIFNYNNPYSESNEIDLHSLNVKEAVYYLSKHMIECIKREQFTVICIVGVGSHSSNGRQLRPAIENLCSQLNIYCEAENQNPGILTIDIKREYELNLFEAKIY